MTEKGNLLKKLKYLNAFFFRKNELTITISYTLKLKTAIKLVLNNLTYISY